MEMKIELKYPYGKHVDALVAQYVMGWQHFNVGYWGVKPDDPRSEYKDHPESEQEKVLRNWLRKSCQRSYYDGSVGDWWIHLDDKYCIKQDRWTPSTDLEQAYKALNRVLRIVPQSDMHIEHLLGTGWCCSTCSDEDAEGNRRWKAFKSFETLPQAMCAIAISWCLPKDVEVIWPKENVVPDDDEEEAN